MSQLSTHTTDAAVRAESGLRLPKQGGLLVHLRPADILAIGVPLAFAIITLAKARAVAGARQAALELIIACSVGLLARIWATNRSSSRIALTVGNFYAIATIGVAYTRINPLINGISTVTFDRELQALDHWIFGLQPSVWIEQYHQPWLTEILFICYSLFFFWQLALGVVLHMREDKRDFEDYFLTVIAFYMISYIGYVTIPAIGPRFDIAHSYPSPLEGLWLAGSIEASFRGIPMVRDCFPSGHTGLTLLVLFRALDKKAFKFFWVMLPFALLLIVSTVYCRFHYVSDLFAALPFVAGVLCVDAALRRMFPSGLTIELPTWRTQAVRRTT